MKQFLVIQLARFGDLVQTKRLIKSIEAQGQVHLCVDVSLKDLAKLLYPQAIIHTVLAHKNAGNNFLLNTHKTIVELASIDFSTVYNINYTMMNMALVRVFKAEIVRGYTMNNGQIERSTWIEKAFTWTRVRRRSPINIADFWAYFHDNPCAPDTINPIAKGHGKGVGVVLAGRESRRSLPMPVLAQVVRTFFEVLNHPKIYLLGSATESVMAKKLIKLLPLNMSSHISDLSGKTSWQGLFDAVEGLDAIITPDTGTMHLAAHLGVPVHAFFLSSAWCHETGPYGVGHTVWQWVGNCAPCLESATCSINVKCLKDFTDISFLRALTLYLKDSLSTSLPAELTCQTSKIDSLGSTWQVYMGEEQPLWKEWRQVVAEYCGIPLVNSKIDINAAQAFYEERDWALRHKTLI